LVRPINFLWLVLLVAACSDPASDDVQALVVGGGSGGAVGASPGPASAASSAPIPAGAMGASAAGGSGNASGGAGVPAAGSSGSAGSAGALPVADAGIDAATSEPGPDPGATLDENKALIPHASWACGMPGGIPAPKNGTLVFEADLMLGEVYDLGVTQYGQRTLIEVDGGMLKGPKISGRFLAGGLEYQLALANGAQEIEGVNILRTDDNAPIYFRSCGTAPGAGNDTRFVADFEAGNSGGYAWLNTTTLVGTRTFDAAARKLHLALYEISGAPVVDADAPRVTEPDGVPDQTWECAKGSGTPGPVVYMESVGIGGGISVGASKRGSRNIIPITGGTFSGRLKGNVLAGGADFQLRASAFELDARYTLKTDDDQLIIVRNCGPVGALIPVFEARADGPYAWLNANEWLSSDPGISIGAVNLIIYERN
jgi:hypothetical protein